MKTPSDRNRRNNILDIITKNTAFHVIMLLILGFGLRLYAFRQGEIIISSDEIYLYQYSMKPVYGLLSLNIGTMVTELFRFFNFSWGWATLMFSSIFVLFLTAFNVPLTEITIHLPYVFVGVGSIIAAYFFGKELYSALFGFIVGLFITFMASHVAFSRTIGVNGITGLFFFFVTMLCFLKYCKTSKKTYLVFSYIWFAFYFVSDNQAIAVLPVLFFMQYIYSKERTCLVKIKDAMKRVFSLKAMLSFFIIILPTIAAALYLVTKNKMTNAYLNLFHSKPLVFDFYLRQVLSSIIDNIGVTFSIFLIVGLFFSIILIVTKKATKESKILFVWFFFYTIPWLFLVPPSTVNLRVYNTYTISSLIFLSTYVLLYGLNYTKKIKQDIIKAGFSTGVFTSIVAILFSICISSFFVIQESVYGRETLVLYAPQQVFGAVHENNGIKTIGYYTRKNLEHNAIIFADAELFVAEYYFGRQVQVIAELDLTPDQTRYFFAETVTTKNVDYVYITAENEYLFTDILEIERFFPIVYAVDGDEVKGILYKKQSEQRTVQKLDIADYDKKFDQEYGNVEQLFVDYG